MAARGGSDPCVSMTTTGISRTRRRERERERPMERRKRDEEAHVRARARAPTLSRKRGKQQSSNYARTMLRVTSRGMLMDSPLSFQRPKYSRIRYPSILYSTSQAVHVSVLLRLPSYRLLHEQFGILVDFFYFLLFYQYISFLYDLKYLQVFSTTKQIYFVEETRSRNYRWMKERRW